MAAVMIRERKTILTSLTSLMSAVNYLSIGLKCCQSDYNKTIIQLQLPNAKFLINHAY